MQRKGRGARGHCEELQMRNNIKTPEITFTNKRSKSRLTVVAIAFFRPRI